MLLIRPSLPTANATNLVSHFLGADAVGHDDHRWRFGCRAMLVGALVALDGGNIEPRVTSHTLRRIKTQKDNAVWHSNAVSMTP